MLTVEGGESELLDLFARYNRDLWPAHVVAYAIAVTCIVLLFPTRRVQSDRAITTLLALLWGWLAVVFQGLYATDVNPLLGLAYAALFLTQALLLVTYGFHRERLVYSVHNGKAGTLGWMALGYAVVAYPLLGVVLGHGWPESPVLGMAPCPTTIATFGLLLLVRPPVPSRLLFIPLLWALLATGPAMDRGVYEDAGLLLTGVLATVVILVRDRHPRSAPHQKEPAHQTQPAQR